MHALVLQGSTSCLETFDGADHILLNSVVWQVASYANMCAWPRLFRSHSVDNSTVQSSNTACSGVGGIRC